MMLANKHGLAALAAVALIALPIAVVSTPAQAETAYRVDVSDLNMASPDGKAAFADRVDVAANNFCRNERNLTLKAACQAGIRQEAAEKAATSSQFAARAPKPHLAVTLTSTASAKGAD